MHPLVARNDSPIAAFPDVYSDLRMLRFLRKDTPSDPDSAADRFRSYLKWRDRVGADGVRAGVVDSKTGVANFQFLNDRMRVVADCFPCDFERLIHHNGDGDDGGNPVAVLRAGLWDTPGITKRIVGDDGDEEEITLNDFLEHWIFVYESIHHHLYHQSVASRRRVVDENGTPAPELVRVDLAIDLSGMSLGQYPPTFVAKIMPPWLKLTQAYYPETTRRIYILNPPRVVRVAWRIVSPFLSLGTIEKIRFVKGFHGSTDEFCRSVAADT